MRLCEIEHVHSPSSRENTKHCSLIGLHAMQRPLKMRITLWSAMCGVCAVCVTCAVCAVLEQFSSFCSVQQSPSVVRHMVYRLNSNNTLAPMHTQIHGAGRFISRSAVKHLHASDRVKCWLSENEARPMRWLLICSRTFSE